MTGVTRIVRVSDDRFRDSQGCVENDAPFARDGLLWDAPVQTGHGSFVGSWLVDSSRRICGWAVRVGR